MKHIYHQHFESDGLRQSAWKPTERIMKKKNKKTTYRPTPGSTTAVRLIDSHQDVCDKWATGATNTIKLPMHGTNIGRLKVRSLYSFRERLNGHDNKSSWRRLSVYYVLSSPRWLISRRTVDNYYYHYYYDDRHHHHKDQIGLE